jgi:6,7-dimethyl-8-ribityllumazine synthase
VKGGAEGGRSKLPDARGLKIVILRSAFNPRVVDGLLAGARSALSSMGVSKSAVTVEEVPGAFELPLAARAAAGSGRFHAVVALGAVVRGDTDHYEHIAREAAAGLAAVARETGTPIGFGVLTVASEEQALVRAAPGPGNKGAEAARAAVAMVHVVRRLRGGKRRRKPSAVGAPAGSASTPPKRDSLPRRRNLDDLRSRGRGSQARRGRRTRASGRV